MRHALTASQCIFKASPSLTLTLNRSAIPNSSPQHSHDNSQLDQSLHADQPDHPKDLLWLQIRARK
jgi:hypothetical protein